MTTPKIGDVFIVPQFPGTAVRFVGHPLEYPEHDDELICEDDGCDHVSEMCWLISDGGDVEPEPVLTEALVVMIGDDRRHCVSISDLTPYDDRVCSCGQIDCTAEAGV